MRRFVRCLAPLAFAAAAAVTIGGCKQQAGERCQISGDCAGGLACNARTMTCEGGGGGVDGNLSPDAKVDGGPPADATVDAMVDGGADAMPDAMPDAMVDATFR
jgi:hypothetical protein